MDGDRFNDEPRPAVIEQLLHTGPVLLAYGRGLDAEDLAHNLAFCFDPRFSDQVRVAAIDEATTEHMADYRTVVLVLPYQLSEHPEHDLRPFVKVMHLFRAAKRFGLDDAISGRMSGARVGVLHLVGPPALLQYFRRRRDTPLACREHAVVPGQDLQLLSYDATAQRGLYADIDDTNIAKEAIKSGRAYMQKFWPKGPRPDADELVEFFAHQRVVCSTPVGNRRHPAARLHRPLGNRDERNMMDLILDGYNKAEEESQPISRNFSDDMQAAKRRCVEALAARFPGYERPWHILGHLRDLYLAARNCQQHSHGY